MKRFLLIRFSPYIQRLLLLAHMPEYFAQMGGDLSIRTQFRCLA